MTRWLLLPLLMAAHTPTVAAKTALKNNPVCYAGEDCELKWGRAVSWVINHGANIVQRTDDFILTQPGMLYGEDAIQINRISRGNQQYEIVIRFECASIISCKPRTSVNAFIDYVNGDTL